MKQYAIKVLKIIITIFMKKTINKKLFYFF